MKRSLTRHSFRLASARAIPDARLRAAVRKTAGVLADMRAKTVASKPDFDALRDWGRSRKIEVSGDLAKWADQFAANVERQGGIVHRAKDAADAGRIITEIAKAHGVQVAVKSKSMTSEEVGLNQLMQAAGVEVTETDLGEFIIQLADEHPSHILAPAIHRSQDEVRSLFAEKLCAPDNLDVEGMVRFARKVLRHRFLEAGMGITGCNFAVADTGTVTIVTNEGNGRMCTSLPPVHVALVGMEKIIPSIKDLPDFLSLLTCSATGQRASSYISMTTGPRRAGECEGPEEVHVVLLDNGRTNIAAGPWREILHCLHCGSCLNHCPVYNAVGGHAYESPYSGPMGTVLSSLIWGENIYPDLANACTLCGRCVDYCAVKVPLRSFHRTLRNRNRQATLKNLLPARLAAYPGSYRRGIAAARKLLRNKSLAPLLRATNQSAANWLSCRELPTPTDEQSFRQWWQQRIPNQQDPPQLIREEQPAKPATVPGADRVPASPSQQELFERYRQRATAIGVELAEITPAQLAAQLQALIAAEAVSCTALPSGNWPPEILQQVTAILQASDSHLTTTEDNVHGNGWHLDDLINARLGVTWCNAFLAETGSMVFAAGPGNGTLASLLPEVHLAISSKEALFADLKAYFKANPGTPPSRLTQISGPSRTGDIEGTMTVGVHGPRRVIHWILATENNSSGKG